MKLEVRDLIIAYQGRSYFIAEEAFRKSDEGKNCFTKQCQRNCECIEPAKSLVE